MSEVENDYVKFWLHDGLLFSKHKKTTSMGLKEVKETIELRHQISNNRSQYWCMDINHLIFASNEAHDYIDKNGQDLVQACAVVVNSFLAKFIVDVFMNVKKPRVPMKIFSSEERGVKWLKEMQDKQKYIDIRCLN